jgi:hypothetical protein
MNSSMKWKISWIWDLWWLSRLTLRTCLLRFVNVPPSLVYSTSIDVLYYHEPYILIQLAFFYVYTLIFTSVFSKKTLIRHIIFLRPDKCLNTNDFPTLYSKLIFLRLLSWYSTFVTNIYIFFRWSNVQPPSNGHLREPVVHTLISYII